jgi:hypothetical protein
MLHTPKQITFGPIGLILIAGAFFTRNSKTGNRGAKKKQQHAEEHIFFTICIISTYFCISIYNGKE